MHSTLRPLFLVLASAALAAACSSSGTTTTAAPSVAAPVTPAPSAAAPSEAASEAPSAATGSATINLSTTALGDIIVDGGGGKTVYAFLPDSAGTPTCYDQCAATWPPLLADAGATLTAGAGLDASKLTTVDRTDGTKQVKYGDWPLYYFGSDAAAGDTNGQGIGTKWYVVDATGAMIK